MNWVYNCILYFFFYAPKRKWNIMWSHFYLWHIFDCPNQKFDSVFSYCMRQKSKMASFFERWGHRIRSSTKFIEGQPHPKNRRIRSSFVLVKSLRTFCLVFQQACQKNLIDAGPNFDQKDSFGGIMSMASTNAKSRHTNSTVKFYQNKEDCKECQKLMHQFKRERKVKGPPNKSKYSSLNLPQIIAHPQVFLFRFVQAKLFSRTIWIGW